MSLYMAEMTRQGNVQEINGIIEKLQKGNDLNDTPTYYLRDCTIDQYDNKNYQNLSNLGYVVGAVRAGVAEINSDAQEQADLLNSIFALGFGSAGKYGPNIFKVTTVWGYVFVSNTVKEVTDQVKSGNTDFGNAIEELALPSNMTDSDFEVAFGEAIDRVIRNN